MEILLYISAFFIALGIVFMIVEYPYHLGGIVVFLTIYHFNIELPLPLDARGLLTLILFFRLYIFDKTNAKIVNTHLFKNKIFWLIIAFSLSIIISPIIHSDKFGSSAKIIILNWIVLIIGFLLLINPKGKKIFLYSVIAVSIASSIDLFYTYYLGKGLNVVRLVDAILGRHMRPMNHNFPGMLAAMGIFFVFLIYARKEASRVLLLVIGLFLLAGLILSTSRSGLLALIVIIILMNFIEEDLKENIKRIVMLAVVSIILMVMFFFSYNAFLKTPGKTQFVDKMYYRLIDEPLQIVGLSNSNFDIYSGKKVEGSMKFRASKWAEDINKFNKLNLEVQLFGLGPQGLKEISRKEYTRTGAFKRQLAAHNGYIIILIERGIIGLLFYLIIIVTIFKSSLSVIKYYQLQTPVIYLFLFIVTYSFAQNAELVSPSVYLILGGILGNIHSANSDDDFIEEKND